MDLNLWGLGIHRVLDGASGVLQGEVCVGIYRASVQNFRSLQPRISFHDLAGELVAGFATGQFPEPILGPLRFASLGIELRGLLL